MNKKSDSPPTRPQNGGGIFIALGALLGAVTGVFLGQPSIGLLSGFALGVLVAVALWLRDR